MLGLFRKKASQELQEAAIGRSNFLIDLPAGYVVEVEDDGDDTILTYDPNAQDGILRFSVYHVDAPQERGEAPAGIRYVRDGAKEKGKKLRRLGAKEYYTDEEDAPAEDGAPGKLLVWLVGFEESVILISCWVSAAGARSAAARLAIRSAETAIESLRNAPFHTYDAPEGMKQEILPLRSEDDEQLRVWREAGYALASRIFGRPRFFGTERDLAVIQELLDHEAANRYDEDSLRGLGVIFGDHLARKLDMQWVTVEDGWGLMPGLTYKGLKLVLYPTDMILKRVERSESFDVIQLFNMIIEMARKEIDSGKVKSG